jgi:hypothetical protein
VDDVLDPGVDAVGGVGVGATDFFGGAEGRGMEAREAELEDAANRQLAAMRLFVTNNIQPKRTRETPRKPPAQISRKMPTF